MLLLYMQTAGSAASLSGVLKTYFQDPSPGQTYPTALHPDSRWPRRPPEWERRVLHLPAFVGYPHQEAPDYDRHRARIEPAGRPDQPVKKQRLRL